MDPLPHPLGAGGSPFCFYILTWYVFHSDWLEGAEGPRQAGASARGPRRGEVGGGPKAPSLRVFYKRTSGPQVLLEADGIHLTCLAVSENTCD